MATSHLMAIAAQGFRRSRRADWSRTAMADSTGARLTYGETLIRALVLGPRSRETGELRSVLD